MTDADAEASAAVMKEKSIEEIPCKTVSDPDAADKKVSQEKFLLHRFVQIRGRPKKIIRPRGKKGAKLKRVWRNCEE